ncbi:hypothetical protein [Nocardia brasiliensis]|uniref:hypothetical protein n=1 Tax=Nocardia brasiliensis TaxID=37326 RepID=UPI00366A7C9D
METGRGWPLLPDEPKLPGDPLHVLERHPAEREQKSALRQLADAASSGDPEARNRFAIGLWTSGRREDAERVWHQLTVDRPDMAAAQLNLATCHLARGHLEKCSRVLRAYREVTDPGSSGRSLAEQRIAELEQIDWNAARQTRLLQLRVAALRERADRGIAQPDDLRQMTRALFALTNVPRSGIDGRDVLDAARRARAAAPDDTGALEELALGLMLAGTDDELREALRELERVAPHSVALAAVREQRTDLGFDEETRDRQAHMRQVAARAFTGDRAAEEELRIESQKFPRNPQYRVDLLIAAYNRGDYTETRRLADELAADPAAGHFVHFHIAQFYWLLGEYERGRRHFVLAYETAATERDRADVREAIQVVGAGTAEELGLG